MAILVDEPRWPHRGELWCHLVSDFSFDELHRFVQLIGVPRVAFQGDHYDLPPAARQAAIVNGAVPVSSREVVRALSRSGLRRGPAIGRQGLAGVAHLPAPELSAGTALLRQWQLADLTAFPQLRDEINADAVLLALRGFGRWAVSDFASGEVIGRIGLTGVDARLPFAPKLQLHVESLESPESPESLEDYRHVRGHEDNDNSEWRDGPGVSPNEEPDRPDWRAVAARAEVSVLQYAAAVLQVRSIARFNSSTGLWRHITL